VVFCPCSVIRGFDLRDRIAGLSRRFFPLAADRVDPADMKRVIIAPPKSG
jgi:hypothetical protein